MYCLCLLIPDISTTKRIADHVKTNGVSNGDIHVLGKSALAIEHLHLHQANLFQTTNLRSALLKGAVLGVIFGTLMGLSLFMFSPFGFVIHVTGIVVFTLVGVILGLWISGLVGIGVQNPIVEQAGPFIREGKYLMIIDLNNHQEKNIIAEIEKRFPQVVIKSASLH